MSKSVIYLVETPNGKRLVQAGQKTTAINHVVRGQISARSVTAPELYELTIKEGLIVEEAGNLSTQNQGERNE